MALGLDIPIWPGSSSFTTGSTPFGFYDNDASFQADADKVANWCARRIGYPIVDVELQDVNFYACFEEAITEYSAQVNQFNIREGMMQAIGAPTTTDLTQKETAVSLNRIIAISSEYGTEAGSGGNVKYRTGSFQATAGVQRYDLNALFRDIYEPSESIEIKKVFHEAPPAIVRYFDPFVGTGLGSQQMLEQFGFGNMSPGVSFLMMPIYADLMRIEAIEFNDQIRRSQYSFYIRNNEIQIFPIPIEDLRINFQYIRISDRANIARSYTSPSTSSKVSDYSNIPYSNIQYNKINAVGHQWIYLYTLALVKEMLGWIRTKYSTVPIPNAEVTLNGSDLLTQAAQEKEKLITQLRENLEEVGRSKQMEKMKNQADHLQDQLQKMPLKLYIR
jgi:hypothetical protein